MIQTRHLFRIASTCRHWRSVLYGTASFWTTVNDSTGTWEGLERPGYFNYLYRSGRSPLYMHLTGFRIHEDTLYLVRNQMYGPRIRELYCAIRSETFFQVLSVLPMPDLRHAVLVDQKTLLVAPISVTELWPKLESLAILRGSFLPTCGFKELTKLLINSPNAHGYGPQYNLGHLLELLAGCPRIEIMYLRCVATSDVEPKIEQRNVVRLDYLQRFTCIDPYRETSDVVGPRTFYHTLFSHLALPDACVVRLGTLFPSELATFSQLLAPHDGVTHLRVAGTAIRLFSDRAASIQAFDPTVGRYTYLEVQLADPDAPDAPIASATLHNRADPRSPLPAGALPPLSTALAACAALTTAHSLWVGPGAEDLFAPALGYFLPHLSRLHTLIVCPKAEAGFRARDLLAALIVRRTWTIGVWASGVACPALRMLRIDCADDADEEDVRALVRQRADAGSSLDRLILGRFVEGQYVLREFNAGGECVGWGDERYGGIWEDWMAQLSERCLDESERSLEDWKPWKWGLR